MYTNNWNQNVDSWLASNPNATADQMSQAATNYGGSYDAANNAFSFYGETYKPTSSATQTTTPVATTATTPATSTATTTATTTATPTQTTQATQPTGLLQTANTTPVTYPANYDSLSPDELVSKLNAYKTTAPTTQEQLKDQQSLWNTYQTRYAFSDYNYSNMGGMAQDWSLKPADYLQQTYTNYASPVNSFLSSAKQDTPSFQRTQQLLTAHPEINQAIQNVYSLNPSAFQSGSIDAVINNLAGQIEQIGSEAAIRNFYNDQQNLVDINSGSNPFYSQDMGNSAWSGMQNLKMGSYQKADDTSWQSKAVNGLGQNQIGALWRDPSSGGGVAVKVNKNGTPDGLIYYAPDGTPLSTSTMKPEDLYLNAEKYGINLSGIGDLGGALTQAGINYMPNSVFDGSDYGIDFAKVADGSYLKNIAGNGWDDAYSNHYDWQNNFAVANNFAAPSDLAQQQMKNQIGDYNAAAQRMLSSPLVQQADGNTSFTGGIMSTQNLNPTPLTYPAYPTVTATGVTPTGVGTTTTGTTTTGTATGGTSGGTPVGRPIPGQGTGGNPPPKTAAPNVYSTNTLVDGQVAQGNISPWEVTADQTVEGRLSNLLDDENQLVQMAKTQGLQDANARGLLNSSLGAEAGALAHYQYAMPIAQADATTYASAARENANNQTNMNLQNANSLNDRSDLEYTTEATRSNLEYSTEAQKEMQQQQLDYQVELANLNNSAQMARLDAQNQASMEQLQSQLSASAQSRYGTYATSFFTDYANKLYAIQTADMDVAAKETQLASLNTTFQNFVGMLNALSTSDSTIAGNFNLAMS